MSHLTFFRVRVSLSYYQKTFLKLILKIIIEVTKQFVFELIYF